MKQAETQIDPREAWDPLNGPSAPGLHWTTSNIGEAMPGVQTPLSWTLWAYPAEHAAREGMYAIGAISRAERVVPPTEDRFIRAFCGRVAQQIEFMTMLGDRMPGTSGQEAAVSVFGEVPQDIDYQPTTRRYPIVAWRLPLTHVTAVRQARAAAAETDAWYRAQIGGVAALDLPAARRMFRESARRLDVCMTIQAKTIVAVAQPLFQALSDVIAKAGVGDLSTLSGSGGAEMAVVSDIWQAAQGRLPLETVIANHGFHGPMEGELSSRVWREDDAPLTRMLEAYAERENPVRADDAPKRAEQQRMVLAAFPAVQRPAVRLVLRLAESRLLIRGVAKRAFLQAFDVSRASARRIGELLAAEGRLGDPDDVFYLTVEEQTGELPREAPELIERRRERRKQYVAMELPSYWVGEAPVGFSASDAGSVDEVTGVGVSPGVAEGIARVVDDPSFAEVEPDEILVAPTTDPSWASIMFVSSALVVDIGGPLSHAAVVARELGIPCVVGSVSGTREVTSGDRIRVDGDTGVVTILERAGD